MKWYYGIDGQQVGPVEFSVLMHLAASGRLQPDDLVWNPDMGAEWKKASTVSELVFSQIENAAPAPHVPTGMEASTPLAVIQDTAVIGGILENSEITRRARASLQGNWGLSIGTLLLSGILIGMAGSVIPVMAPLLLSGPFSVGMAIVFLDFGRKRQSELGRLFEGFQCFGNALGVYLLTSIFTLLWSLLFIVPGIIAAISYSMVYFILVDDPKRSPMDAIDLSKEMMRGYKWQFFCLGFRFLGWILLSLFLTLGIGMLWVAPYMQASYAHFYEMVRTNYKPRAYASSSNPVRSSHA